MSTVSVRGKFIEQHGLWSPAQAEAAEQVKAAVEERGLETIRVSWPDQHGLLRGKSLTRRGFYSALENGTEITMAPFFFDTANAIVFNPFIAGGGFGIPALSGSPNVIMVPDPLTFQILPWAPNTGWLLADLYMRSGTPFPFAPRTILRTALERLRSAGYEFIAGLEIEWYLTKIIDPMLEPTQLGAPGSPADPPRVLPVAHGYNYLLENHLDEIDEVVQPLRRDLEAVGLPVRTIDDEWAPSQIETTFDVLPGLAAADATVLFRNATKQFCRRRGYLASFMCNPAIPGFYSSGWHLHSSLARVADGQNAFVPRDGSEVLPEVGRQVVGGLLEHACAASVFTTPTVNGYRRRRPYSLAPDRATWGFDNRAAMIRVLGGPGDPTSHIENRVGEPAANPYLYIASQVVASLDGIENRTDPGPMSDEPYAALERPTLPTTLAEALDVLKADSFYRKQFGDQFIDYLVTMKGSEVARFQQSLGDGADKSQLPEQVTEWEHREYFELF